jgi:hypothetical protein
MAVEERAALHSTDVVFALSDESVFVRRDILGTPVRRTGGRWD